MHSNPFDGRHQYSFDLDVADDFEDVARDKLSPPTEAEISLHETQHQQGVAIMGWIEAVARAEGEGPSPLSAYAGVVSATLFLKAGDYFTTTILIWVDEQDRSYLKSQKPLEAMYYLVRQMQTDGSVISQDFGVSTLSELTDSQIDELHGAALTLALAHGAIRD